MADSHQHSLLVAVLKYLEDVGSLHASVGHLAAQLASQSERLGLLPTRTDYQGNDHALTYEEAKERSSQLQISLSLSSRALPTVTHSSHGGSSMLLPSALHPHSTSPLPRFMRPISLASLTFDRQLFSHTHARPPSASISSSPSTTRLLLNELSFVKMVHQKTTRGHQRAVFSLALNPAQNLLVTGSEDCLVKIWSFTTGWLVSSCRGHTESINDLSVSIDGSVCASASDDRSIRLWSLKAGSIGEPYDVGGLFGHQDRVTRVVFHPTKPHILLSSSNDRTLRIWCLKAFTGSGSGFMKQPFFGVVTEVRSEPRHAESSFAF